MNDPDYDPDEPMALVIGGGTLRDLSFSVNIVATHDADPTVSGQPEVDITYHERRIVIDSD